MRLINSSITYPPRLLNDLATAKVIQHQTTTSGRNFVRNRRYVLQRTVVAFTCRLRQKTKNKAGWLKPRKSFEDGPSQCRRYSLYHHAQFEHVRTWMGHGNIESKRTLHVQISRKTTTWMKEVGDQGARLKRCGLDSIDLGFCPLAEFLMAESTGSFTTRRSVSMIQAVSENVRSIERNLRELTYTSNLTKALCRRANTNVSLTLKINCRSPQTN
jgi:hypothetical protein